MIVLGVGGNVGTDVELVARFRKARDAFEGDVRSAPLYRTAPIGPAQPPFLNTALRIEIDDARPAQLIDRILTLERTLGRTRTGERDGPRSIDLDLLLWDDRIIAIPALSVPHPRLHRRRFALAPLVALVGADFEIPGRGRAGTLLDAVADQQVELLAESW